jgi:hypothetical protein
VPELDWIKITVQEYYCGSIRVRGTPGGEPVTAEEPSFKPSPTSWLLVALAWSAVSIPLLWGIGQTVKKAAVLFR